MRIAYFVHDLNDPAVAKRVRMLKLGGLDAVVAGFWRGNAPPVEVAGLKAVALGRTFDSRLIHRGIATLHQILARPKVKREIGHIDLILARNLEMLAIAGSVRRAYSGTLPIVYEVLDIHHSLLSEGIIGRLLRLTERMLMRSTALLIVSSPAYLRQYFQPRQFSNRALPTALIENKLLLPPPRSNADSVLVPQLPWRIGWFGMIRCSRSLEILRRLADKRPDLIQVEIRGRPSKAVFDDFSAEVARTRAINFGGAYAPDELERLYRSVHFNWTIDYFEEGANSQWLLPNRIYEGGCFDAVPLARRGTETARWLEELGFGAVVNDPQQELESFFESLSPQRYLQMKDAVALAPRSAFIADQHDCEALAATLTDLCRTTQQVGVVDPIGQAA
jgi:succinoglycan biosynthesis protein ExoL